MKKHVILSVLSKDRPGIVADITHTIYELDGDLADISQSVLSGYFIMTVIAQFESRITIDLLKEKIEAVKTPVPFEVMIKEIDSGELVQSDYFPDDVYVVTAQGVNRTGLVYSMGAFCKDHNINIIEYDTTLTDNIYSMIFEIDLTNSEPAEVIHDKLNKIAEKLGLKIVMQHKSLFQAVNEISLQ